MSRVNRAVANPEPESDIQSDSGSEYEDSIAGETSYESDRGSESVSDSDDDDITLIPGGRRPAFVQREWDPSAALAIATQPQDSIAEVEDQIARFDAETSIQDFHPEVDLSSRHMVNNRGNKQSAEFYRRSMRSLNVDNYKRKTYAKGTLVILKSCQDFWQMYAPTSRPHLPRIFNEPRLIQYDRFCLEVLNTIDWEGALQSLDFVIVYHFLWWYLNQTKSPSGKSKRPVTKSSSLITFWCIFRLMYERSTLSKIDDALPRGVINNVQYHRSCYLSSGLTLNFRHF